MARGAYYKAVTVNFGKGFYAGILGFDIFNGAGLGASGKSGFLHASFLFE